MLRVLGTCVLLACAVLAGCRSQSRSSEGLPGGDVPQHSQASPAPVMSVVQPAGVLVDAAVQRAKAEGKVVLIEFGASWCVWCSRFQTFIHEPSVAPIVDRNFVVLTLTVKEHQDKKALENPGGAEALGQWGGEKSGLPFYVFLNAAGEKIGSSNAMPDGSNIGFPATAAEITRFVGLIERMVPRPLPAGDRSTLLLRLQPPPG